MKNKFKTILILGTLLILSSITIVFYGPQQNFGEGVGLGTLPVFNVISSKILPRISTWDFGLGSTTATSSAPFAVDIQGSNASLRINGLTSCNTIDTTSDGTLICGTDATGGGGGGGTEIEIGVGPTGDAGFLTSSVSFSPSGFNVTDKSGWALVDIDYTNGPASRSIAQTITGNWVNTAFPWADNEVADNLTINGGTVTWTDLASYPTGCTNQFVTTIGDTLTCATVDISAMTNLTVSATGLELSSDAIALTTGYMIPLTASASQWNSFYQTPSSRITAGTGIDWASNTLNVNDDYLFNTGDTATGLLIFSAGASGSNSEWTGYASASFFRGSAFNIAGNECSDAGDTLAWNAGVFTCGTDAEGAGGSGADTDIPFITLGNTSSLAFERALTGTANQITVTDGGANGAVTLSVPSIFSIGGASLSANLEVGGYASISGNIIFQQRGVIFSTDGDGLLQITGNSTGSDHDIRFNLDDFTDRVSIFSGTADILTFSDDLIFTSDASISANFEVGGYASISSYRLPSATGGLLGDCDAAGDTLNYDLTTGKFVCGTDATSAGSGVASNSLDFDEFVNAMTVDADTTITGGAFNITFDHASVSGNFELTGATSRFGVNAGVVIDNTLEIGGTASISSTLTVGGLTTLASLTVPGTTTLAVVTGVIDMGGATSLEIPNGTNPTINVAGQVAIDESGFGQFAYYASGSVHTLTDEKKMSFSIASGSFLGATGSRSLQYMYRGITVKRMSCQTKSATSVVLNLSSNGTTDMDQITAATTRAFDDGSIANATVAKGNNLMLEWRSMSGEVDYADCTVTYQETRE